MSDFIPDHIADKILQKLPVKRVLVLKAVCKSWGKLISHPRFAQSQFESQTLPTRSLLLAVTTEIPQLESLELDRLPVGDRTYAFKLTSPFTRPNAKVDVIFLGSSNGLICSCHYYEELHSFHIWNPSTGKSQLIDSPPIPSGTYHLHFHGFGYVAASQDYKLIINADYQDVNEGVQVFSVRENGWKKSMEAPCGSVLECQGVNVKEKLHWVLDGYYLDLVQEEEDECLPIVAFDLEMEEFQRMRLPNLDVQGYDDSGDDFSIALFCCDGLLCLWHYGRRAASGSVEIWVMETYGDSESWNMRYNFQISPESPISFIKPLVVTGSSQVFVRCSEEWELELVRIGQQQEEEERVLFMNGWRNARRGFAHECGMILYDHTLLWHGMGKAENEIPDKEGRCIVQCSN